MKILGYRYLVQQARTCDEIGAMGRLNVNQQVLQVASDISHQQAVSTVLHEVIEALNFHLELGMGHPLIMALEGSLYQVLTDNGVDLIPLLEDACLEGE